MEVCERGTCLCHCSKKMLLVKCLALALLASSTIGFGAAQSNGVLMAGQTLPQVT